MRIGALTVLYYTVKGSDSISVNNTDEYKINVCLPQIVQSGYMFLDMMITRSLAWKAHKLKSLKRPTI